MARKKSAEKQKPVVDKNAFDGYVRPYIEDAAENALKAYRRIGYVDGVQSAEAGENYSLLVANEEARLAITVVPIIFDGNKFSSEKGTVVEMNKIVAIKKL